MELALLRGDDRRAGGVGGAPTGQAGQRGGWGRRADDAAERARRQDRLQRAEVAFDPLPFDAAAARAYGRIYAAVIAHDRKARGGLVTVVAI